MMTQVSAGFAVFGQVAVTIPTQHTLGELELPAGWKFWSSADPNKHFTIKAVAPLAEEKALEELRAVLGKARSNSILLFVHGYRVTFIEAALRTAQLVNDLRFPGVTMFYSWPSAGTAKSYSHDEEAAELSVRSLSALLATLAAQPATEIYILAHSMGGRVTTKALTDLVQSGHPTDKFHEILLAAPDINADLFRAEIAPRLLGVARGRRTIYASSGDLALRASAAVHDFRRVGETAGGVQVFAGFDTIDVSAEAPRGPPGAFSLSRPCPATPRGCGARSRRGRRWAWRQCGVY
jgi:esterase/lipase superfamily enzyme